MADPFSFALATVAQIGISYLFPSEGPRLKDLKVSASTYGAAIPWVFGQTRVPGNMIWSMPIRERKKKSFAGKGGFSNQYKYSCTFAMGLCKGPIKQVRKVWADGKLVYDASSPTVVNSKIRMRFYVGDENQVPDSAIEANLGDNAVAFRGLAYILFDDMPLQDFGNRIPQITVEVLVGSSQVTVEASQITENDGTTPISDTFAAGEGAFDLVRRLGYLRDGTKLRQFSTKTGFAVQDVASADMGFTSGDLTGVLVAGHDGAVFVTRGPAGATTALDRLDPFSLHSVASTPSVPTPVTAACARDNASNEYLLTVSATGDARLFKALDLSDRWGAALGGTADVGPFRACGRDADATGQPSFYVLMSQPGASDLVLTKVSGADAGGPTIDEVHAITGTSLSPRGIAWDSAGSSVILFWMDGTQAYIAKWSEDLAAEAWRTPIAGCPTLFSGESVLLSDQIAWVYGGRLYAINVTTGEMIDKEIDPASGDYVDPNQQQVDWDDYLTRYADVKSQYFIDGWTVSGSPEGYAQWHYENFGLYEGRTITLIGAGAGGGFALTGAFTGLSATYQVFDSTRGIVICLNGLDALINLNDVANGVSVGTIVTRLLSEGGVPSAMTDLQPLFQMPIRGYGWASGTDIKNILDELRRLFLFDLVEQDGVIVAVDRGDPTNGLPTPNEIIRQGALGSTSEDAVDFWQETRMQEADIPAQVTLAYMNIEADFEASTARSARISNPIPTMFSRQQVAMEINVVLTPAEAKTQVNKILYAQWLERTQHTTRLPWAYLNLDPADVIEVHMDDGRIYQDRIHQSEIGADFVMAIETYSADEGAYDIPTVVADGGAGAGGQTVADVGAAIPFIINTPLLRDQDDQGGSVSLYYMGIGHASSGAFRGAGIFRSVDNIDYDFIASRDSDVEWGSVLGVMPSPSMGAFALDWKTKLTIAPAVDWFELESITDDDLWTGANACLVGDEVIQFRDAVQNANGTWTIWNLLRGRRGTEYACDRHVSGERFIFLSNATIATAGDLTTASGLPRYFKAVAAGQTVQEAAIKTISYQPRDLMPYAPGDVRRDLDTGGLTVSWARRTRLGGNLQDGTGSVALVEKFEKYEAYVLAAPFAGDPSLGAAPTSFVRKYETSSPSFVYAGAEQIADGFNPLTDDLHVAIYQLSDAVGRGFPATRTIQASDFF